MKRKLNQNTELAERQAIKRIERLESIEYLLTCSNPELADATTTWYPLEYATLAMKTRE